jgi:segregation and condensation protein B
MELTKVIEALLFAAEKPLTIKDLLATFKDAATAAPGPETEALQKIREGDVRAAIETLEKQYAGRGSGLIIQQVAGGFQMRTCPETVAWVEQLFDRQKASRLSQPALETLAIIAYRQPISRADIEAVRGVAVDGVVATLLERGLIRIAGRAELPGRPLIYETTARFMEDFCLKSLDELPNVEELRKMELQKHHQAAKKAELPLQASPAPTHENQHPAPADRSAGSPAAEIA